MKHECFCLSLCFLCVFTFRNLMSCERRTTLMFLQENSHPVSIVIWASLLYVLGTNDVSTCKSLNIFISPLQINHSIWMKPSEKEWWNKSTTDIYCGIVQLLLHSFHKKTICYIWWCWIQKNPLMFHPFTESYC